MGRRRIPWDQVSEMAMQASPVWRLHRSLAGADHHLLQHARRRVPALKKTDAGSFEFARGNVGMDDLGKERFDLYVRWIPKGITRD